MGESVATVVIEPELISVAVTLIPATGIALIGAEIEHGFDYEVVTLDGRGKRRSHGPFRPT